MPIAVYMMGMALVTVIAVWAATETHRRNIVEDTPQERQLRRELEGRIAASSE